MVSHNRKFEQDAKWDFLGGSPVPVHVTELPFDEGGDDEPDQLEPDPWEPSALVVFAIAMGLCLVSWIGFGALLWWIWEVM